jgi:hypothetical protein
MQRYVAGSQDSHLEVNLNSCVILEYLRKRIYRKRQYHCTLQTQVFMTFYTKDERFGKCKAI